MSTPAPALVLTVVLDKEVYEPGDTVTATLTLTQLQPFTVTGSGTVDGTTVNGTATASVQEAPADAVSFGISDNLVNAWTQASQAANVGTYTETIPAAAA